MTKSAIKILKQENIHEFLEYSIEYSSMIRWYHHTIYLYTCTCQPEGQTHSYHNYLNLNLLISKRHPYCDLLERQKISKFLPNPLCHWQARPDWLAPCTNTHSRTKFSIFTFISTFLPLPLPRPSRRRLFLVPLVAVSSSSLSSLAVSRLRSSTSAFHTVSV